MPATKGRLKPVREHSDHATLLDEFAIKVAPAVALYDARVALSHGHNPSWNTDTGCIDIMRLAYRLARAAMKVREEQQ